MEIGRLTQLMEVIAATLGGGMVSAIFQKRKSLKIVKVCREFTGMVVRNGKKSTWYEGSLRRLEKKGAAFHFGKWISPERLVFLDIGLGLIGFLVAGRIGLGMGCLFGILLGLLPEFMIELLNNGDNERMLPELRSIYGALSIQLRAGLHVSDALQELYSCVQEPRLYEAFLELAGDLCLKADLFEGLEKLQSKFQNQHIDALCITLLQETETGQAVELLKDLTEQIQGMEQATHIRKKGRLDRSITFYQLGMLSICLGLALYSCVTYMLGSVALF